MAAGGKLMNGIFLLLPSFIIQYGLMYLLNKEAAKRAAHFPPTIGAENIAYWVYQISTFAIIGSMFFLRVTAERPVLFYSGAGLYAAGLILLVMSVIDFSRPAADGMNRNGLYRFSRNPMYVSYFICFAGCAALTKSVMLTGFVMIFQISAHWIILSEERWCAEKFGTEYSEYKKKVRRYI